MRDSQVSGPATDNLTAFLYGHPIVVRLWAVYLAERCSYLIGGAHPDLAPIVDMRLRTLTVEAAKAVPDGDVLIELMLRGNALVEYLGEQKDKSPSKAMLAAQLAGEALLSAALACAAEDGPTALELANKAGIASAASMVYTGSSGDDVRQWQLNTLRALINHYEPGFHP